MKAELRPDRRNRGLALLLLILQIGGLTACAYRARVNESVRPEGLAELWTEPVDLERRDLFYGPGGARRAPQTGRAYKFVALDTSGSSRGYDVEDQNGSSWSVKIGPEAQTEVVVSRLVWAVGFHQPAVYYVPDWSLAAEGTTTPQPPGRFRLDLVSERNIGRWAWHENPFVGATEFEGLFVLMVLVNNWDLKTSQNVIYQVGPDSEKGRREYVVRDLGASLGRTRWFFPGTKGDIEGFEREPFIKAVENGRVEFQYRGAWREPHLKSQVSVQSVRWVCGLLARLSDRQWSDAFRAGGYDEPQAKRYVQRLKMKIMEGLALPRAVS
jgi:hypothetical protein